MDLQQELAPNEEFALAGTTVQATFPETDLFAGIREPVPMEMPVG